MPNSWEGVKLTCMWSFALNTVVILSRSISWDEINLREPFMSLPFIKGWENHAQIWNGTIGYVAIVKLYSSCQFNPLEFKVTQSLMRI